MGKFLFKLGLVLLVLSGCLTGTLAGPAETLAAVAVSPLVPAAKYAKLDQTIARLLADYHYRNNKLDNAMAGVILDNYLRTLDFSRSYFLAADIAAFKKKYGTTLDDNLLTGNTQPAYDIFNLYQKRVTERTEQILALLRRSKFDFNVDESLEVERKDAAWATRPAELEELWRKRLKNELLTLVLAGKEVETARRTLEKRYESRLRTTLQSTSDDVFQLYMNAVSQSFDPHTAYFSPRSSENFNIQMRLSLEGIGTVLRLEEDRVTVVELVPGGPAELSDRIRPNDAIIAVGQGDNGPMVDVVGWRLDDVVDLIRGPRGSVVRLQMVSSQDATNSGGRLVRLTRDVIKLEKQAAKSEVKTLALQGRPVKIGIISVPTFYSDFTAAQQGDKNYRSTTRDVRKLLDKLERDKVDGIVMDLRQNGGGSLQEAVELTGLFIKDGPVVQVRAANGGVEIEQDPDPDLIYGGPLAVLVDRFSASASEIFAGAIQDYGRGVVIGDPTFGKGTVQTLIDLNRFVPQGRERVGQLKLTIAKFYRISGSSTQNKGVIPDISLPSPVDSSDVGESAQEHALPWDEITPVSYHSSRWLVGLVPELDRRHQARMNSEPALRTFLEESELLRQTRERKTVSLQRAKRQAEEDQLKTRQRSWDNQRRIAAGLKPLRGDEEVLTEEGKQQPDLLLDETARILADMINLLDTQGGAKALVYNQDTHVNP